MTEDERLARRLGIKLERRTGPHPPGNGSARNTTWFGYSFIFTTLLAARGKTQRCRPGAMFYGSSFGGTEDAAAWTKALEEYTKALRPSERDRYGARGAQR